MRKSIVITCLVLTMILATFSVMAQPQGNEWLEVNNDSEKIEYEGRWRTIENENALNGSYSTARHGSEAVFKFTGSKVKVIGTKNNMSGIAKIYLNEKLKAEVNFYSEEDKSGEVVYRSFESDNLEEENTLEIVATGESSEEASNAFINIEAISYVPTQEKSGDILNETINEVKETLYQAPSKPGNEPGAVLEAYYSDSAKEQLIDQVAEGLFVLSKDSSVEDNLEAVRNLNDGLASFEEKAQTPAIVDETDNDYQGMINGEVTLAEGKVGNALDLDGEDYIDSGKTPSELGIDGKNSKTVEMWVYTRNGGGLFDMGSHSAGSDFALRNSGGPNKYRGQFWGGDFDIDFEYESEGQWVHFAVVHEDDMVNIYADGEEVISHEADFNTGDDLTFRAGIWGGDYFDGLIDEVRIWDTARNQEQIEENMDKSLNDEENLILNWTFEDWE